MLWPRGTPGWEAAHDAVQEVSLKRTDPTVVDARATVRVRSRNGYSQEVLRDGLAGGAVPGAAVVTGVPSSLYSDAASRPSWRLMRMISRSLWQQERHASTPTPGGGPVPAAALPSPPLTQQHNPQFTTTSTAGNRSTQQHYSGNNRTTTVPAPPSGTSSTRSVQAAYKREGPPLFFVILEGHFVLEKRV